MDRTLLTYLLLHFVCCGNALLASMPGDSMQFSGQASAWGRYIPNGDYPASCGSRYIPLCNYSLNWHSGFHIDAEAAPDLTLYWQSANNGWKTSYRADVYRAWIRASGKRYELRAGVQKIEFGPAQMLRPMLWFADIQYTDPLQMARGVSGTLGRYYCKDNSSLWIWMLRGSTGIRSGDSSPTQAGTTELGGRLQKSIPVGELGISTHHRKIWLDAPAHPDGTAAAENRVGLDGRFDGAAGYWFESVWIRQSGDTVRSREMLTIGCDYTIAAGNGIGIMAEHLVAAGGTGTFATAAAANVSGVSAQYPIGISDKLSSMAMISWKGQMEYYYMAWNHRFRLMELFISVFYLDGSNLAEHSTRQPAADEGFGGQIMLVYHH